MLFSSSLSAQEIGSHPQGIKWRRIETDTLSLIFPKGMERQANKVANLVHQQAKLHSKNIGGRVPKLRLIFQNETVEPNGFVTLMPFRSEFYTTPPQDLQLLGSTDWLTTLSIHEYRHALQLYNQRRGIVKLGYILNGNVGWMGWSGLIFPSWYYEGDAVYAETQLSRAGRGRMPSFYEPLWSMAENGEKYSYKKLRNGSYKDNLPNHYTYGYLLCSYINNKFSESTLSEVNTSAARLKGFFYPYSKALIAKTGFTPTTLYSAAYDSLAKEWKTRSREQQLAEGLKVTTNKDKTYKSYEYPTLNSDSTLIAVVKRLDELDAVYQYNLTSGKEEKLFTIGNTYSTKIHTAAGLIVWNEVQQDARWQNRSRSFIKTYDQQTKKVKSIKKADNLFSPSLSADGKRIAAVVVGKNQDYQILILSASSGEILNRLPNFENIGLFTPTWSLDSKKIAFVGKRDNELALFEQSVEDGSIERLTSYTHNVIANPTYMADGTILFEATFNGKNNIYQLAKDSSKIQQLTQARIGGVQPSSLGSKIAYSSYSIDGNSLFVISKNDAANIATTIEEPLKVGLHATSIAATMPISDSSYTRTFTSSSYRPWAHLVNIHSWSLEARNSYFGGRVASQDYLSKLNVNALWMYSGKEHSHLFEVNALWGGWYPYIGVTLSKAIDRQPFENILSLKYDEQIAGGQVIVPINISRGYYNRSIQAKASYSYHKITWEKPVQTSTHINTYTLGLSISNLRATALQNINPKFGQSLKAEYTNSFESSMKKEAFRGQAHLFFPGIATNHSIEIGSGAGWETNTNSYRFYDTTVVARGYELTPIKRYSKVSADYSFPICYPDWGINGFFFLKRIRVTAFGDYARAKLDYWDNSSRNLASTGIEVIFDMKVFNLLDMPYGFRHAFLLNKDPLNPNRKNYSEVFIKLGTF